MADQKPPAEAVAAAEKLVIERIIRELFETTGWGVGDRIYIKIGNTMVPMDIDSVGIYPLTNVATITCRDARGTDPEPNYLFIPLEEFLQRVRKGNIAQEAG